MMTTIPDFNDSELGIIKTTLQERYKQAIETQLADSELKLDPFSLNLTWCPTIYWEIEGVSFVIFKTALQCYRCQFFYSEQEHYGTGIAEYDNIADCVTTLLQVQADHANQKELQRP
jgi:hypothetical protein